MLFELYTYLTVKDPETLEKQVLKKSKNFINHYYNRANR